MGTFEIGDRVIADLSVQGMRRGEKFEVVGVNTQVVVGLDFTALVLRSLEDGRELGIVNGALLLSRAT